MVNYRSCNVVSTLTLNEHDGIGNLCELNDVYVDTTLRAMNLESLS